MLSIILQVVLGLGFIMFGFMKFSSAQMIEGFKYFGYSAGFRIFTGVMELAAAALLIAGIWNDTLTAIGSLLVVGIMLGAIFTHIKIHDKVKNMAMPIILLGLGATVLALNYSALLG